MAQLNKKVLEALNNQLQLEIASAHIYWAMAADFSAKNLHGFAKWMFLQYQEEMEHALKFYKYLLDRGAQAVIPAIEKPKASYPTPLAAFETAYKHECKVTASIYAIADLAKEAGDWATVQFLQWFFEEQVEEEAQTDEVVQLLKMAGDSVGALFQIDKKLGGRKSDD